MKHTSFHPHFHLDHDDDMVRSGVLVLGLGLLLAALLAFYFQWDQPQVSQPYPISPITVAPW